jgi:redox-sensitive bicupin YhaK (pirin superfamily)
MTLSAGARERLTKSRAAPPEPGFAGPGHTAVEVLRSERFGEAGPFVFLMDDRLDFQPGQAVGGAHPHAGLETVTLMLEGSLDDSAEGLLEEGDLLWMTAGKGIIHNEEVTATGRTRLLQLWIALPNKLRYVEPRFERVLLNALPIRREPGAEARLYSGRTGDLVSATRNHVPVTLVEFRLEGGASIKQVLPEAYGGLFYVVSGSLTIDGTPFAENDIGWIDRAGDAPFELKAGGEGARVILYAGEPLAEPIVQRGPFVAGSMSEIAGFHREYHSGAFRRLSELAA